METVIDLDIPSHEPVLVLNGLLDTDTNTQIVVSHSVGAFSNGTPSFIYNANVLLYKDNQFIDSLLMRKILPLLPFKLEMIMEMFWIPPLLM